jgi:hypothetical protein
VSLFEGRGEGETSVGELVVGTGFALTSEVFGGFFAQAALRSVTDVSISNRFRPRIITVLLCFGRSISPRDRPFRI